MSKDEVLRITNDEHASIMKILTTKTDQEIENSVEILKNWIFKQPHLPKNEENILLRRMLLLNKFSIERTKHKLDLYYTARNFLPEFFVNNHPLHPTMQKMLDFSVFLPLPILNSKLERISYIILDTSRLEGDIDDKLYFKMIISTIEIRIVNDLCSGDVYIIDLLPFTFGIISKMSPKVVQNSLKFMTECFSDRVKQMHFINVPSYAHALIGLIKSLLKAKMGERIFVHKELKTLHQEISPKLLPKELGGSYKTVPELRANWRKYFESKNDWLKERANMKSNEKLRVGESAIASDMFGFGIQGSFQKLEID